MYMIRCCNPGETAPKFYNAATGYFDPTQGTVFLSREAAYLAMERVIGYFDGPCPPRPEITVLQIRSYWEIAQDGQKRCVMPYSPTEVDSDEGEQPYAPNECECG